MQPGELDSFFQAIDSEPDPDFKDFVTLCLLTGQRKSNVLSMRWWDLDLKEGHWNIPGETMKNLQSLTLALSPTEIEILKRRKKHASGEYVFPGNGRTGHYVEPRRAWARLLKRAGIKDLHIHDVRRSLARVIMPTQKKLRVIVDLDEDVVDRLVAQAQSAGLTLDEHLCRVLKVHAQGDLDAVLTTLKRLERLIGRNIYWSALPFIEGPPKRRLNEAGLESFWDRSGYFASKIGCPEAE